MTSIADDAVQALWSKVCQATDVDPASLTAVEHFGDSAAMADDLLALVLAGTKTATAGLARTFELSGEPLSKPGDHWVVLDGQDSPRCVLRTVQVRVGLLESVDAAFAWDEGEGDRTREYWLDAHRRAFLARAEREGLPYDEQRDLVVFERFKVVWAEPAGATSQ